MLKKYLTLRWLLRLALLLLALLFVALFFTHTFPFRSPADDLAAAQKQEAKLNADNKKSLIEDGGGANADNGSPKTSGSENPGNNNAATPTDTQNQSTSIQLSARQEANGSVTVFTKLYGYSAGTCRLEVTNGQATQTQTAEIIYQSQFSTCAGFSVPSDKLGAGTWDIKLTATSEESVKTKSIAFKVE
jgi:hypothetical protein